MSIIQLIKNFSELQDSEPCVFILRHAEKPIATTMCADIANTITLEGAQKSKNLGAMLQNFYPRVGVVRSSPVKRCLDTAHGIFSAYPNDISVVSDTTLGGHGAYVSNNHLAAQHFLENPLRKDIFIGMQHGEIFAGMREVALGTNLLLKKVIDDLTITGAPGFYVTHDCILALFVNGLTGKIIDEINWFQFLDGVCIKKFNDKIDLFWENTSFNISKRFPKSAT